MAGAMDPSRPRTFHDQAYGGYNNRGSSEIPIANFHYPGPQGPDLAVSLDLPRPLFYGEYCHLNCYNRAELAADPGLRDEYGRGFERMWEKIFGSAEVIGGAIWSGVDDVFLLPSGRATGYGEWGPIDGWRREKPEYWHIKKSYSPVRIGPARVAAPSAGRAHRPPGREPPRLHRPPRMPHRVAPRRRDRASRRSRSRRAERGSSRSGRERPTPREKPSGSTSPARAASSSTASRSPSAMSPRPRRPSGRPSARRARSSSRKTPRRSPSRGAVSAGPSTARRAPSSGPKPGASPSSRAGRSS